MDDTTTAPTVSLGGARLLHTRRDRVRMVDTDASGLLYFGAIYRWSETSFSSWFLEMDRGIGAMLSRGIAWPVVHSEADYRGPLTMDDEIELRLYARDVGDSSFELLCDVHYGETVEPRITIRTRHVYGHLVSPGDVHGGFAPQPIPPWLRAALQ